jgi:membrane fusion protein (multidrug efflux system)
MPLSWRRVSGYVAEVSVENDNQDVKAGTPLVRIDQRDFAAKAMQAQAQVGACRGRQCQGRHR